MDSSTNNSSLERHAAYIAEDGGKTIVTVAQLKAEIEQLKFSLEEQKRFAYNAWRHADAMRENYSQELIEAYERVYKAEEEIERLQQPLNYKTREGTVHGQEGHSYSLLGETLLISHPQWSYALSLPAKDVLTIAKELVE